MIKKVFCYSSKNAKKNGNRVPIIDLIIWIIIGISILVLNVISTPMYEDLPSYIILVIIALSAIIVYYAIIIGVKGRAQLTAFAIGEDEKLYMVFADPQYKGMTFAGTSIGKLFDGIDATERNTNTLIGGTIGGTLELSSIFSAKKLVQQPEVVVKIIENAHQVKEATVTEIRKIYSYKNLKKSIKIECDYQIMKSSYVMKHQKMTIEKSYSDYEELINHIINMKNS